MNSSTMPSRLEQEHLLYEDHEGALVGVNEVMLLDPVPVERIPRLRLLLDHPNLFIVYQAVLVLTAWGDTEGLDALEVLVDRRVHTQMEFSPHRIHGYDNVYDELADALSDFRLNNSDRKDQRRRIFEKLLALYGPCDFESKLKYALLDRNFVELVGSIELAIDRALAHRKPYLASQLLVPLAHLSAERALARFPAFSKPTSARPQPLVNVAEALRYIPPSISRAELRRLATNSDSIVSDEAKRSLVKVEAASEDKPHEH